MTARVFLWTPIVLVCFSLYMILILYNRIGNLIAIPCKHILKAFFDDMKHVSKGTPVEDYFDRIDIE